MKSIRSSRRAVLNSGLAVVLVGAAAAAYLEVGADDSASASSFTRVATVSRGTVLAQVSASGNLALAAQSALAFGASGKVTAVDVSVGQTVKPGQVLATVDPTAADLALTEAKEQLTVAQDNLAKAQDGPSAQQQAVYDDQLTADQNAIDTAQQNLDNARKSGASAAQIQQDENALTNAQDQLRSARDQQALSSYVDPSTLAQDQEAVTQAQAAVDNAQAEVAGTTITAPSAGTILSIAGQVGSQVSAGTSTTGAPASSASAGSASSAGSGSTGTGASSSSASNSAGSGSGAFITMADVSRLQITANVSETDIDAVKIGQDATVTLNADPAKPLGATVAAISPTSTVVSNVVEYAVTLDLTGAAPGGVRPGQSASILITTGEAANVLYVPSSAITTIGSGSFVTVVQNGKDVPTRVTTGVVGTTDTEITSGLTQGEQVLLAISSTSGATTGRGFGGIGVGGFGGAGGLTGGGAGSPLTAGGKG
jgi:multidrug efflux pump subunit AcrA (membrane-fusion protein)